MTDEKNETPEGGGADDRTDANIAGLARALRELAKAKPVDWVTKNTNRLYTEAADAIDGLLNRLASPHPASPDVAKLREALAWVIDAIDHGVPESCGGCGGPNAQCDASCQDAFYFAQGMHRARAVLAETETKEASHEVSTYRSALEDIVEDCKLLAPHVPESARGALDGMRVVAENALRAYAVLAETETK